MSLTPYLAAFKRGWLRGGGHIIIYMGRSLTYTMPCAGLWLATLYWPESLWASAGFGLYLGFLGGQIIDYQDKAAKYKAKAISNRYNYDAAMFEISELVRVAITNREGLDDFISWNFPKEKATALARKERNL